MIPVIVISVPRSHARRSALCTRLDAVGVRFSFHDAVDAGELDDATALRLCPNRRSLRHRFPLSLGEIACAASHLSAMRQTLARGDRFACILEDDVVPSEGLAKFLDPDWLNQLPRFDILKLAGDGSKLQDLLAMPVGEREGYTICAPLSPSWGGQAYVISEEGARRVLGASSTVYDSLDVMLFRRPLMTARILEVRPNVLSQDKVPSLLSPGRLQSRAISKWRAAAGWLPSRLSLWGRKMRRYLAFCGFAGLGGFFRLKKIAIYPE